MSTERKIFLITLPFVFLVGWQIGSFYAGSRLGKRESGHPSAEVDRLIEVRSGRTNPAAGGKPISCPTPKTEEEWARSLSAVPFSALKRVYVEKRDAQFEKVQSRYSRIGPQDEASLREWEKQLFESYQRVPKDSGYYHASADWTFRGGKSFPAELFFHFYSTGEVLGEASEAESGKDLCWSASARFTVGGKPVTEGTSTCIDWTAEKSGKVYAIFDNYTKEMSSYYDTFTVPLPGFDQESGGEPEWFDSAKNQWQPLAGFHWEEIPKSEYLDLEKSGAEGGNY